MRNVCVLSILILIMGCNSKFISIEDVHKKYEIESDLEIYNDFDAVVILDKTEWDMNLLRRAEFQLKTDFMQHVIKRINNINSEHSTVKIPIFENEDLREIQARIIKPDGSEYVLDKDDFFTIQGTENSIEFYNDLTFTKFTFPGLEEGSIVEYFYRKQVKHPFMRYIWTLQEEIPILHKELTVDVPKILMTRGGWKWYYRVYNDSLEKAVPKDRNIASESILDEKLYFQLQKTNIPAFKYEPLMPRGLSEIPHVRFRPGDWTVWNDLSRWYYYNHFSDKLLITDTIREKAKDLTLNVEDEYEKAKICYDYVKKMRYVSVNLNNSGISPKTPETVLEKEYGDCKDKSILLIALLKSLSINAEPVLLLTSDYGKFDKDFPAWNFNHMITKIILSDEQVIWADPTASYTEFGYLPAMCQNVNALAIQENGECSIYQTHGSSATDNFQEFNTHCLIDEQNTKIDVDIYFSGEPRSRFLYSIEKLSYADKIKHCKHLINDQFLNAKIDTVSVVEFFAPNKAKLSFTISNIDMINKQGNLAMIQTDIFKLVSNMDWLLEENRNYPIQFDYPQTISQDVIIEYSNKKFSIESLPQNYQIGNQWSTLFNQNVTIGNNILQIRKTFTFGNNTIKSKDYHEVKTIFNDIQSKNREQIILKEIF